MKNKIKKNLLFFTAVTLISGGASPAKTGCISSKPVVHTESPAINAEQMQIITESKHLPWVSADGGKAYFNAWNGMGKGKDFEFFLEECKEKIENEKSAETLENSEKTEMWVTKEINQESRRYSFLNNTDEFPIGKHFLRVDAENHIIYTVKRSDKEFLFEVYLLFYKQDAKTSNLSLICQAVSKDIKNYINVLLPIDKKLFFVSSSS